MFSSLNLINFAPLQVSSHLSRFLYTHHAGRDGICMFRAFRIGSFALIELFKFQVWQWSHAVGELGILSCSSIQCTFKCHTEAACRANFRNPSRPVLLPPQQMHWDIKSNKIFMSLLDGAKGPTPGPGNGIRVTPESESFVLFAIRPHVPCRAAQRDSPESLFIGLDGFEDSREKVSLLLEMSYGVVMQSLRDYSRHLLLLLRGKIPF